MSNPLKSSLDFFRNFNLKISFSTADVSLQKTTIKHGRWWNTFRIDENPLPIRKWKKISILQWKRKQLMHHRNLKKFQVYKKNVNIKQEKQNIQEEFSQEYYK